MAILTREFIKTLSKRYPNAPKWWLNGLNKLPEDCIGTILLAEGTEERILRSEIY